MGNFIFLVYFCEYGSCGFRICNKIVLRRIFFSILFRYLKELSYFTNCLLNIFVSFINILVLYKVLKLNNNCSIVLVEHLRIYQNSYTTREKRLIRFDLVILLSFYFFRNKTEIGLFSNNVHKTYWFHIRVDVFCCIFFVSYTICNQRILNFERKFPIEIYVYVCV